MKSEEIKVQQQGIGSVLSYERLAVPLNQREYSWEKEHVRTLLHDLGAAITDGRYFLGTLVLTKGISDIPEVSDGQQRLATSTILLAAIRDYFFRVGDKKRANTISSTYLMIGDLDTTEDVPRLTLNVDDNVFFRKFVISDPDSKDRKTIPLKESHKRIADAHELAAEYIRDLMNVLAPSDQTKRLLEWVNFIKNGAQVIVLRVPDDLNAFVMFETLNDRGLEASRADLIKNYLLKKAGPARMKEAQQKWAKMTGVLETLGQDDITVTYLHHLLITKHGPTREREVLTKVKETVTSTGQAFEFLDEIADSANDYAALFNSDAKKWNSYGTSTRKHVSTINRDLRVLQIRPLMFAVAKSFSIKEAKIAFKLFVFWSVRFLMVGGRGGLLDRNYSVRAQEVASGKIKTAKELTDAMEAIVPSDAMFEAAFSEARVSQVHLARYYLRVMEQKRKGKEEHEWVPQDDENEINLEHILPENPDAKAWPSIDRETAAANYRRIGNMVMLQAKKNSMIGNSSFADKKTLLKDSTYLLTAETAKYNNWGIKEIIERQKELARLAVKTWPLKVS